jgi:hypothetical protein
VPLPMISRLMARLSPHLIVEWIPKEDPMVKRLLAAREDIFADYSPDGFRAAFGGDFEIVEEAPIEDSGRVLFRMHGRG